MRILAALILAVFAAAACSKKNNEPEPIAQQTWKVSDQVFHNVVATWYRTKPWDADDSLSVIGFIDDTVYSTYTNSLALTFIKKPEGDKLYRIVYNQPKNEDQVAIRYNGAKGPRGGSQDEPEQYLKVTKEGSYLRFVGTDLTVQEYTFVVDFNTTLSLNLSD